MQDMEKNLLSTVLPKYTPYPPPPQAQVNIFYFTCSCNERPESQLPSPNTPEEKKISIITACFTTC